MLVMEKALKTLSTNEIAVESVESCRQLALVGNCSGGMALPIMPRCRRSGVCLAGLVCSVNGAVEILDAFICIGLLKY